MNTDKSLSIYVHIPFCASKCHYCDFTSFIINGDQCHLLKRYFAALSRELSYWIKELKDADYVLKTLYIGGGTPSVVDFKYFQPFLHKLFEHFETPQEFTCEVNPGSVRKEFLLGLKEFGCNRISMGLQSPTDKTLKLVGRNQSIAGFMKKYALIRSLYSNVNIDLICGLPESLDEWYQKSLAILANLKPEHISLYMLELEKETALSIKSRKGEINIPSFEYSTDTFERFIWRLTSLGYQQYEISNFALEGYGSLHNDIYWKSENYIGLGVSAGGFINELRYVNSQSLEEYLSHGFEKEGLLDYKNANSQSETLKEYIFMGLRLKRGIDIREMKKRFFNQDLDSIIELLSKSKFMNISDGFLRLDDFYFIHNREPFEYFIELMARLH